MIYETTSRRINRPPSTMSFPTKNYGKVDFSNIVRRFVFSCLRMSERDEHHFMKDYLSWMKPGLEQEPLTVFNFGYDRHLPFPSISLTPKSTLRLNLQTPGMQSQSRRSIAIVGKKFLTEFENIMLDIERIHEDTQALPLAIFVQTKSEDNLSKLSSHPMRVTPYLVGILL